MSRGCMSVFERVKVGKGQRLSWGYTLAQAVDGNVVYCEQTRECAKPRCESCGSLRTQRSRERHAEECAPPAQERLVDGAWGGGGEAFLRRAWALSYLRRDAARGPVGLCVKMGNDGAVGPLPRVALHARPHGKAQLGGRVRRGHSNQKNLNSNLSSSQGSPRANLARAARVELGFEL